MPKFKLIGLSNPTPGQEAEYNRWYDGQHISDLLAIPGVKSAKRYKRVAQLHGDEPSDFLAIYDIECDDAGTFLAVFGQAAGNFVLTESIIPGYTARYAEHETD